MLLGPHPPPPAPSLRSCGRSASVAPTRGADGARAARDVAEQVFSTERARGFFAGHSAHSMLPLERRPSAGFGMSLCVARPRASAGRSRAAARSRSPTRWSRELELLGGESVRVAATRWTSSRRADVVLPTWRPASCCGSRAAGCRSATARQLRAYRHGPGAFKLDWALDGADPVDAPRLPPRRHRPSRRHARRDLARPSGARGSAARRSGPSCCSRSRRLFDRPARPAGKHTAWAYCHVPNGSTAT